MIRWKDKEESLEEELKTLSKRQCKKLYLAGDFGLSDAIRCLMFHHQMEQNEILKYLGL